MSELKTLKDFEDNGDVSINDCKHLRQEAIKHIKELQKEGKNWNDFNIHIIVWIKNFFNITEEDLK